MIRTGILTVSDRGYSGEYEDLSGPAIRELVTGRLGMELDQQAGHAAARPAAIDPPSRRPAA